MGNRQHLFERSAAATDAAAAAAIVAPATHEGAR